MKQCGENKGVKWTQREKISRKALNIHKTFPMKENLADSNPGGRLEIGERGERWRMEAIKGKGQFFTLIPTNRIKPWFRRKGEQDEGVAKQHNLSQCRNDKDQQ